MQKRSSTMKKMVLLVRVAILAAMLYLGQVKGSGVMQEFSESDKQKIVDAHNDYRREEEAADMDLMVWDEDLAYGASLLAATCVNDHDFLTWDGSSYAEAVGQNLFASSSEYGPTWPLNYWFTEKVYYDFDTGYCSDMCYHYTQMIWWSNDKIGCAKTFCDTLITPGKDNMKNMYYYVCNYGPGGNYENQAPFAKGNGCTQCRDGATRCKDKLCVRPEVCEEFDLDCECKLKCRNCGTLNDDCSCTCAPGYTGSECAAPCEDTSASCGTGALSLDHCVEEDSQQEMYNQCPLSCGFCEPEDAASPCVTTTPAPKTTTTTVADGTPSMYETLCNLYGLMCDLV